MQETAKGQGIMSFYDFVEVCRGGSLRRIRDALMAGADVNARDEQGETPLMWAVYSADPELVGTLIKAGADVNAQDNESRTALMLAAEPSRFTSTAYEINDADCIEIVEILLKAGADADVEDVIGLNFLRGYPVKGKNLAQY